MGGGEKTHGMGEEKNPQYHAIEMPPVPGGKHREKKKWFSQAGRDRKGRPKRGLSNRTSRIQVTCQSARVGVLKAGARGKNRRGNNGKLTGEGSTTLYRVRKFGDEGAY